MPTPVTTETTHALGEREQAFAPGTLPCGPSPHGGAGVLAFWSIETPAGPVRVLVESDLPYLAYCPACSWARPGNTAGAAVAKLRDHLAHRHPETQEVSHA